MSKIGNLRSNGYGDGNLHTYDRKGAKPKKTLADVRKARELAQEKARQAKQKAAQAKQRVEQTFGQRTQLNSSVIDHNLGLDRTPKSAQESFGVFAKHDVSQVLSQRTPLNPSVIDHNLGLDRAAKSAQESAEAFKAGSIVRQHTIPASQGLQEFTDNMLGIGRTPKSAQESMGIFVKREVEQALSQKTPLNPSVIDNNLGLSRTAKSAQESASAFIEHGLTDTEALGETTKESKGIWGSIKGLFGKAKKALSSGWTKFKSFAKTPKGKWSFAATAVVVVAAGIWAYVADRFSGKNNPATVGPSKAFMPKLEATEEDDNIPEIETEVVEETDAQKTDNDETITDSTKVVPAPVGTDTDNETDEVTDADKTNKTDKIDETKTPATEEEKKEAEEVAKVNDAENKREPATVSGDEYEVVKGDCVWNIAKAHLKELNKDKADYTPSNVEILRHTKELMEINDLHYEADNYVVIIEPGQKLKLKK